MYGHEDDDDDGEPIDLRDDEDDGDEWEVFNEATGQWEPEDAEDDDADSDDGDDEPLEDDD